MTYASLTSLTQRAICGGQACWFFQTSSMINSDTYERATLENSHYIRACRILETLENHGFQARFVWVWSLLAFLSL